MKKLIVIVGCLVCLASCGDSQQEEEIREAEERRIEQKKVNDSRKYKKPASSNEILNQIQEGEKK
jgi:hypothetical protein